MIDSVTYVMILMITELNTNTRIAFLPPEVICNDDEGGL